MDKVIAACLKDFEDSARRLVDAISDRFPLGHRCAIIRKRKGVDYRIHGFIYAVPHRHRDQRRLTIKTDSRGTLMGADFDDVELL